MRLERGLDARLVAHQQEAELVVATARERGAVDLITKPLDPARLSEALRTARGVQTAGARPLAAAS